MSTNFVGVAFNPAALPTTPLAVGQTTRLATDLNGRLLLSPSGIVVSISGTDTPGDDRANPTTNLPVTAFNEYWNAEESGWFRVQCIDLNNQDVPASPTPFFALTTYAVCGGLDQLTSRYSTFAQRSPSDAMANPGADSLLPLDTLGRMMAWDPDADSGDGFWKRVQCDQNENVVTIAGTPPRTDDGRSATPAGIDGSALRRGRLHSGLAKLLALEFAGNMATNQWLMFFDSADTTPDDGATPIAGCSYFIPADGGYARQLGREHFGEQGIPLTTGLAWAISSSAGTLTLGAEFAGSISVSLAT